jgi:hypothetical protein
MTWGSVPQERLTINWRSESLPPSAPRCAVITDGFYENTRMPEKAFLERCDSKRRTGIVSGDQGNSSHVANYNTTLSSESLETGTGSWNSLRSAKQSWITRILQHVQRKRPDWAGSARSEGLWRADR